LPELDEELVIKSIINHMDDNLKDYKIELIELFKKYNSRLLVKPIIQLLKDDSKYIQLETIKLLEKKENIRHAALESEFVDLVDDEMRELIQVMNGLLNKVNGKATVQKALNSKYQYVQMKAIKALGKSKTPNLGQLSNFLKSKDVLISGVAAEAIACSDDKKAIDILMQIIEGKYCINAKVAAIRGLGEHKVEKAIPFFIDSLNHEVKWAAEEALANFDDESKAFPLTYFFINMFADLKESTSTIWERIKAHESMLDTTYIVKSAFFKCLRTDGLDFKDSFIDEKRRRLRRMGLMSYLNRLSLDEKEKILDTFRVYRTDDVPEIAEMARSSYDHVVNREKYEQMRDEAMRTL